MKAMKKIGKILVLGAIAGFASRVIAASSGGITIPNVGLPKGTIAGVVQNFTMWLLGIFGFLAIIAFIVSGIMYLTAAGDEKRQEKAKNQMYWSITGVIVGLMGYIVIKQINEWLNAGGAGLP
jgi:glucose uptake protein GlcU